MQKFILIACFLLLNTIGFGQSHEYYFKFVEPDKGIINDSITNLISIDRIHNDTIYAYANSKEFARFSKLGYKIEILPHPSSVTKVLNIATTIDQMVNWDRYPTYDVYRAMMKKFQSDYPSLCKLDSIGTTVLGRQLYVVKLSDNASVNEAETQVFYTSSMHGNEVTGYILMLRLIDYLLKNYNTDPQVQGILNNMALYINPNANPDGTYAGGNANVSSSTRYNANGIDINRNFPDPRAGSHPDGYSWQPETQAMMSFAANHHFTLAANFHGGTEVVNYPWDTWTSAQRTHTDQNWYIHYSRMYADSAQANSPAGYFNDENNGITNGGDWYVITGGRQDYMNWWHKCREVTIEISTTMLLSTDLLPAFWNYNRAAFLSYLESGLYGIKGIVKNTAGNPVDAKIFIVNHDSDSSHIYTDKETGHYTRLIEPGTWQIMYSSPGYISQIHTIETASWQSAITNDVVLESSEPASLAGTVTSTATFGAIQDVKVELIGTSITPAYTDEQGHYSFSSIPQNLYTIKVSKPGYRAEAILSAVTSTLNTLNFTLEPADYEGFESGLPVEFTCSGGNWVVDNKVYLEGTSSMRSASIGNNGTTSMQITLNVATDSTIRFARRVSSESGYDYLHFYIDDVEQQNWSGSQDWSTNRFDVTSGTHTFKWAYTKDGSQSSGYDCAWVDSIVFPPTLQTVTFTANLNENPCSFVPIEFYNQTIETNSSGQAVFKVNRGVDKPYTATINSITPATGMITVQYSDLTEIIDFTGDPKYNVTFQVTSGGTALEGANIHFNDTDIITTSTGSATFSDIPRGVDYIYTVDLTGYQKLTGQVNILENKAINISLVPSATPVFVVHFEVKDQSVAVENATIVFNGVEQQTSSSGTTSFTNIPEGNYNYSLEKPGYLTESHQVSISKDTTISVELTPVYTVTFIISHIDIPIEGVTVSLNNTELLTGSNGTVSFENIPKGSGYSYSAEKTGYKSVSGYLDVNAGLNIELELTPVFTVIFTVTHKGSPVVNANVNFNSLDQLTSAEGTSTFTEVLYGYDYNYTISQTGYHSFSGTVDVTDDENISAELTLVGIPIIDATSNPLSVWPNPSSGDINIRFYIDKPLFIRMNLFSIDGRLIRNLTNGKYPKGYINLIYPGNALKNGSYILRLSIGEKTYTQIIQYIR